MVLKGVVFFWRMFHGFKEVTGVCKDGGCGYTIWVFLAVRKSSQFVITAPPSLLICCDLKHHFFHSFQLSNMEKKAHQNWVGCERLHD